MKVVKGGKRPRAAVAAGGSPASASELSAFLDSIVAGGNFEKLPNGLPTWDGKVAGPTKAERAAKSTEGTAPISEDEL
jgi:hypothetical protein